MTDVDIIRSRGNACDGQVASHCQLAIRLSVNAECWPPLSAEDGSARVGRMPMQKRGFRA